MPNRTNTLAELGKSIPDIQETMIQIDDEADFYDDDLDPEEYDPKFFRKLSERIRQQPIEARLYKTPFNIVFSHSGRGKYSVGLIHPAYRQEINVVSNVSLATVTRIMHEAVIKPKKSLMNKRHLKDARKTMKRIVTRMENQKKKKK